MYELERYECYTYNNHLQYTHIPYLQPITKLPILNSLEVDSFQPP